MIVGSEPEFCNTLLYFNERIKLVDSLWYTGCHPSLIISSTPGLCNEWINRLNQA